MAQKMTIPGNTALASHISHAAECGSLSHAVILSGQGDLAAAARFAAAAMQCTAGNRPCGACAACDKIGRDIHPDVITVVDEDHKNIAVDVLRDVRADAYILPNEGQRKIYIFPDCSKLEARAQNVMLKVIEEGPDHASFIFCAENSSVLLPTIRSRAVEYKLAPAEKTSASEDAHRLCSLILQRKRTQIVSFCTDLENRKISREELQQLLSDTRTLLTDVLAASYGTADRTAAADPAGEIDRRRVMAAIDILQQFIRNCGYNIGVGHLSGALSVALDL